GWSVARRIRGCSTPPGRVTASASSPRRGRRWPAAGLASRSTVPDATRGGGATMDFREVIETTPPGRFSRPDPVPDDGLRRVLDGTRYAPTGGNRQGVRFIVVRDPAKRRQLKEWYIPMWEQYVARATSRAGAPRPRLLENADHFA